MRNKVFDIHQFRKIKKVYGSAKMIQKVHQLIQEVTDQHLKQIIQNPSDKKKNAIAPFTFPLNCMH